MIVAGKKLKMTWQPKGHFNQKSQLRNVKRVCHRVFSGIFCLLLYGILIPGSGFAQSYDDFTQFSSEPTSLDRETRDIFGRFFQTELSIGTGLFTGGLGSANAPGIHLGIRFILFFDQIWAMELGGAFARHSSAYTPTNTGESNIDYAFSTRLVDTSIGFRYGFDQEALPRGFTTLNPYLAANGELFFRSEKANDFATATTGGFTGGAEKCALNETNNSSAFGIALGGGVQFDVYKENLFVGIDIRYHYLFWPDSAVRVGDLSRGGSYFTLAGALVLNY
jgi:opacity protein-like surface antigen